MNSTDLNSNSRRGFAAMDPEKRRAAAKKGGRANRKAEQVEEKDLVEVSQNRGFAAMDKEKRKQIAKRGGSISRRNRIDWKNQDPIL